LEEEMKREKKSLKFKQLVVAMMVVVMMLSFAGCGGASANNEPNGNDVETPAANVGAELKLATTTSTQNSGLLDAIIPDFEEKTGIDVLVIAVGTGKALQMGRDGEADALLVHAKPSEEEFVSEGHGVERFDVMYNDFVIIGSAEDTAKLKEEAPNDVVKAFGIISEKEAKFISRGDDSGTHKKEKALWTESEILPSGDWYLEAGKGMGDVVMMADELQAYTLSDRATYLAMSDKIDMEVIVEKDARLFNQYGVIAVNPAKNDMINNEGAEKFIEWINSADTQAMIAEFGKEKFGQPLFVPNAK